jgi:4-hydroxy 2-oxovalerate aldolase
MKNVKILDCTLRDGGYVNDFNFGDEVIRGMLARLVNSKVDVIECGFLKDKEHETGSSSFACVEEIEAYIPENRKNSSIVAMIDYGRYDLSKLTPYNGRSIDGIRDCFFKKDRFEAMEVAREIMLKGYNVYVQPVDILGYSDVEILELIEKTNNINAYAFSIVDTFGSMFNEDLIRIFSLIDNNLKKNIAIGFHSHNNMQLSFALSQKFIELSQGKRPVTVDCTVLGMGRGAGNTPTELVLNYMNSKYTEYEYDLNEFFDLIDIYMAPIQKKYSWGYNIPNYIAGIYSSHVHNVAYLLDKHSINSKDMRILIESVEPQTRKRYDYDNLESLYIDYFNNKTDDVEAMNILQKKISGKKVMVLAPGKTLETHKKEIMESIDDKMIVISTNFVPLDYNVDFSFFSSQKRLDKNMEFRKEKLQKANLIITSNVNSDYLERKPLIVNYVSLIKRKKWKYFDISLILLLRLLNKLDAEKVFLAGVDGFNAENNYSDNNQFLEANVSKDESKVIYMEMKDMIADISFTSKKGFLNFITPSIYNE